MNYRAYGYSNFNFIITPEELKSVLAGLHLLEHSRNVPLNYVETSVTEYVTAFSNLYDKLIKGYELGSEELINPLCIGICSDLSAFEYGNEHEYDGAMFKTACFSMPCADVEPFSVCFLRRKDGAEQLNLTGSALQFPQYTAGLHLTYPKRLRYLDKAQWEAPVNAENLPSYADFVLLTERIREITHPLILQRGEQTLKPKIYVSSAAENAIDKLYFLRHYGFAAVKRGR